MSTKWPIARLGDVVDAQFGFPFTSAQYSSNPDDPKLLRGDNIAQGRLRWDGVKRWPKSRASEAAEFALQPDDVVLAMDRPWIEAGLKYAAVSESDLPVFLVQRVARLRGTSRIDTRFLRYVIGSAAFTDHVLGVQTGTAVPHISGSQIREFQFHLASMSEQRVVASILGTLDDKIELNRRTCDTLEAMARALFKSWFVDFDPVRAKAAGHVPLEMHTSTASVFPKTFVDSDLGEIPAGWTLAPLDQIASFRNGLALQNFRPTADEPALPVVKIAQMRTGRADGGERAKASIPEDCILDNGDVVFSWSGSLTVMVWCGGRAALNQHLFRVTSDRVPKWFFLQWLFLHLPEFQRIAGDKATTMGHIQRHHLTNAKCVLPAENALKEASKVFAPLLEKGIQLELESRSLTHARNELLPRLLAGELRARADKRAVET